LGFRVKSEERCWEEGKVLAVCEANRHYVWNYTDRKRIILLVDTIHPDYVNKKYYICSGSLAVLVMKLISTKFPVTKKSPAWLVWIIHKILIFPIMIIILLQNKCNINLASFLLKFKK